MNRLRSLSLGRRLLLAFAIGSAMFGIASAVQASIPDSTGVIHGCYNTSNAHGVPTGGLRLVDTGKINSLCASWERPVSWSAAGPTGLRGATGPAGPTGPSDGGSQVTIATTTVGPGDAFDVVAGTTINNLPAGSYLYSASMYIMPLGGPTVAACSALGTGGSGSSSVGYTTVSTPQWIPVIGQLTLSSTQGAEIECNENGFVHGFLVHGALIVTRVATLH
jgi:hypothetical protein